MKKNDKILLIVFIAVFLSVTAIGLSYAYYTAVIDRGEESASVVSRAGNLEITYTDGVKQIIGANIYPGWQDTKTFTVKNTGDALTTYSTSFSEYLLQRYGFFGNWTTILKEIFVRSDKKFNLFCYIAKKYYLCH